MNKSLGVLLVGYSLLACAGSALAYYLAPLIAGPTLVTGLAGGLLCLAWGLRALACRGGKALPILTLIPVSFSLLAQTFTTWSAQAIAESGRGVALLSTVLLALSVAMIFRIAWSGVVFDVKP